MSVRRAVVIALAISLAVFGATGCGASEDAGVEPAEPPVAEQDSAVEPAEETPEAERPALPADYEEFLAEAAAQANFPFYVPSDIPPDFSFLAEESSIEPDLIGIAFHSDDARVYVLQGAYDVGEGPSEVSGVSATFGPLDAALYSNVGYGNASSELYNALGEAVLAADGPTTYMVFGTGVSRVYVLSTAREMRLYE